VPNAILSPAARGDLRDIVTFIAADDPWAARRMVSRIETAIGHLAEHPQMGRDRPDLGVGLRSLAVGAYLVVYLPTSPVGVVRILSGYRNLPELFN
jgi:toxin ParE1/3/4